jgi:hypothetical protein
MNAAALLNTKHLYTREDLEILLRAQALPDHRSGEP